MRTTSIQNSAYLRMMRTASIGSGAQGSGAYGYFDACVKL